ncbi:MAG: DUF3429 domain-containing protein [Geminicoccaceae bacterium]
MKAPLAEVPRPALKLGFAGLIPFAAGAVAVRIDDGRLTAVVHAVLLGYACAIASFMAGVQWGFGSVAELDDRDRFRVLGLSVVPALIAWLALLAPLLIGYAGMILAFVLIYRTDLGLAQRSLTPAWYPTLRLPLTLGVVLCLASGLIEAMGQ